MDASPKKARDVFLAAIKLPVAEREAHLRETCGDDQDLYQRVSALLQIQAEIGSFHEAPTHTVEQPGVEFPGTVIGPYKLLESIGQGGMGTVWMAQQTEPVKRLVAVKLIRAGMDSKQFIARFEAERQALALMDHPNIARVLDGGTTGSEAEAQRGGTHDSPRCASASGRPYFVMDLVKGVPITEYCDTHHLTPRQRLELFIPVCQAVQHAHQKGIIHRDLKPSNVLVALYDGKAVPKVIDFGVAKAAGQTLAEQTLVTGFGSIIGTLEYMSPEQAEINQLDVDTRSDVYSLGVLLYELLAGSPPFTRKELEKAGMLETLRVIREQEPTKPSQKLSTAEGLPTLAANRGTEPVKLTRLLRGELDWIVMKALEKDRNRRYETANGFAMDVQRYLADEPVQACPPSAWYRFRKFAQRNRLALTGVLAVSVALLLGITISAWQALRATAAADSERSARIDLDRARALADERAQQIARDLERLTAANAAMQAGRWYADTGAWAKAEAELNHAVALRSDHSQVWFERGDFYIRMALWDFASRDYARGVELQTPSGPRPWAVRALLALHVGDLDGYRAMCREIPRRFDPNESLANFENELVRYCMLRPTPEADLSWGKRMAEQAVKRQPRGPWNHTALGMVHYRGGNHAEAVISLLQSLHADPSWLNGCHNNAVLAMAYYRMGKTEEAHDALAKVEDEVNQWSQLWLMRPVGAIPLLWYDWMPCHLLYREAKTLIDGSPPPEDARLLVIRARALAAIRRDSDASALNDKARRLMPNDAGLRLALLPKSTELGKDAKPLDDIHRMLQAQPKQDPAVRATLAQRYHRLGDAYYGDQQLTEALAAYSNAVELGPTHVSAWHYRGQVHFELGKYEESVADYSRAIELDSRSASTWQARGQSRFKLRQFDKAAADFSQVIELDARNVHAWNNRGAAYSQLCQFVNAISDLTRAIELDPNYANAWDNRAVAHSRLAHFDEALQDSNRAIQLDPKRAQTWVNRGVVYGRLGKFDRAISDYSRAIQLDANNAMAWYNRGLAKSKLGQLDESVEDHSRSIELDATNANVWTNRGVDLEKLGQLEKAIDDFSQAINLDSKNALHWCNRGSARTKFRQFELAIADYSRAIELDSKNLTAWHDRGVAQSHLGRFDKTIADFSQVIELAPNDPRTFNDFAWLLATCPDTKYRDSARAIELAKKAISLAPNRGNYRVVLGAARYRAGQWPEAISALEQAMKLRDGDGPFEWFFLAMVCQKLGRPKDAHQWYDKAVEWMEKHEPEHEELLRFRAEAREVLEIK